MGKMTNVVFGFLDFRLHLLIVLLVLTSCQVVSADEHLLATCNGPGGFCSEGSSVHITSISGSNVMVPAITNAGVWGAPKVFLGYCPKTGNGMAGDGCRYLASANIAPDKLKLGGWYWVDYYPVFVGSFQIPIITERSSASDYCIAAWIATHSVQGGGGYWLSYGEPTIYKGNETPCVGNAPPPPPVDLCYVNSGNPISVDFEQVERSGISTNKDGTSGISKSISVTCLGTGAHTINVRLNMIATSWSASQIATSNTALGVSLTHAGQELKNGDSFNMHVQGSATQSFGFSLLRDPSKATTEIATGTFHASATLIVTEP